MINSLDHAIHYHSQFLFFFLYSYKNYMQLSKNLGKPQRERGCKSLYSLLRYFHDFPYSMFLLKILIL